MQLDNFLRKPDFGLLLIRFVIGMAMMFHGIPKVMGGGAAFELIGKAMEVYGIGVYPAFWGCIAALTETIGGLLVLIGYKMRYAGLLLAFMFVTAFLSKYAPDEPFIKYAWPLELLGVFLGLAFVGPGRFSVDKG